MVQVVYRGSYRDGGQDTGVWGSVEGRVASGSVPSIFLKELSSLFQTLPAFPGQSQAIMLPR